MLLFARASPSLLQFTITTAQAQVCLHGAEHARFTHAALFVGASDTAPDSVLDVSLSSDLPRPTFYCSDLIEALYNEIGIAFLNPGVEAPMPWALSCTGIVGDPTGVGWP